MLRSLVPLFAALFLSVAPAQAEQVRLSMQDAPAVVSNLLRAGQPSAAREIAIASLRARPNDGTMLLLLARAELALGRGAEAIKITDTVFDRGDTDQLRFLAARLRAEAHASLEQFTRAQIWLRRAFEYTNSEQSRQAIARDFRDVSRANPLQVELSFGFLPSNNVNNGTSGDVPATFLNGVGGLNASSFPLSGFEISAGADLSYRLRQTKNSATFATASVDFRTYILSRSARDSVQEDGIDGRDYENGTLTFGLIHNQVFGDNAKPTKFRLEAGQFWFEQLPFRQFAEISVSQDFLIDPANTLSLRGYLTSRKRVEEGHRSLISGLQLGWSQTYANEDSLRIGVNLSGSEGDLVNDNYTAYEITADYQFAQPVAGMKFGLGASFSETFHPTSLFLFGQIPRTTYGYALRGSVQFTDIEYYGFQPVVSFERSLKSSNIDFYNRNNFTIGLDLRSSF